MAEVKLLTWRNAALVTVLNSVATCLSMKEELVQLDALPKWIESALHVRQGFSQEAEHPIES